MTYAHSSQIEHALFTVCETEHRYIAEADKYLYVDLTILFFLKTRNFKLWHFARFK